jgi:mRNA interferase MazF
MKPGDIVLIRFPQADLKAGKLRPALVVAVAPSQHADLLLAMISSRIYQVVPDFDEIIDPSDSDYATTGLKVRSVVRLARLGNISPKRLQQIRDHLIAWLQQ